jgi:hypothetical protein
MFYHAIILDVFTHPNPDILGHFKTLLCNLLPVVITVSIIGIAIHTHESIT